MKLKPGDEIDCPVILYADWKQRDINRIDKEYDNTQEEFTEVIENLTVNDVKDFIDGNLIPFLYNGSKALDRLEDEQIDMIKNTAISIATSVMNVGRSIKRCFAEIEHLGD